MCEKYDLTILRGHAGSDDRWQDAHARLALNKATYKPVPMEHFGFIDGISNPVFEGQFGDPHADAAMAIGNGKVLDKTPDGDDDSRWAPLATGEFLLGHPDEAQETDDTAPPPAIMRNGTFLIYRKLHENVGSFNAYFGKAAEVYAKANNVPRRGCEHDPEGEDGRPLGRRRAGRGRAHHRRMERFQRQICRQGPRPALCRFHLWRRSRRRQMPGRVAYAPHQHARQPDAENRRR